MSADEWKAIQALYHRCNSLPADEQEILISEEAIRRPSVARCVKKMLAAKTGGPDFLSRPAVQSGFADEAPANDPPPLLSEFAAAT